MSSDRSLEVDANRKRVSDSPRYYGIWIYGCSTPVGTGIVYVPSDFNRTSIWDESNYHIHHTATLVTQVALPAMLYIECRGFNRRLGIRRDKNVGYKHGKGP